MSSGPGRSGVLVMSYGSPSGPADLLDYYTHIRRGRPPSPDQLGALRARYDAIGGTSSLRDRTREQTEALSAALHDLVGRVVVARGDKHAAPFIEDGVAELATDGVTRLVAVTMAPHWSPATVGTYVARAEASAQELGIEVVALRRWWDLDGFIEHQASSLRDAIAAAPGRHVVVFTAHSLPERVMAADPYPDELFASASAIASRARLAQWGAWGLAWQSAGATPEPWRGPDILEVIDDLAATGRADSLVVCAHGFVSDHLEVRYDLDVEATTRARAAGLTLVRTEPVGADPQTMQQLATRCAQLLDRPGSP